MSLILVESDNGNFNDVKEFLLSLSKYDGLLYNMRVLDSTAAQIMMNSMLDYYNMHVLDSTAAEIMMSIIRVFSIQMLLNKHTQSWCFIISS